MDEPKLEKLIKEMKAGEAGGKLWLEEYLVYIVGVLCFIMGAIVGHFV